MAPNRTHPGNSRRDSNHPQAGFTILEAMIALLVLSLGLMGLAGLQTLSFKFNFQSYERTQATLLIDSMIDRMRANARGVELGTYNSVAPNTPASSYSYGACPQACADAEELARYDIHQWKSTVAAAGMLSNGEAGIEFDPVSRLHRVTISWQEHELTMQQQVDVQLF